MRLQLSSILKSAMKRANIGAPTLSKRTGVPRQTIANWIAGQSPQNLEDVRTIAKYFSMTIDQLCFVDTANEDSNNNKLEEFSDEINAGVFEVVLRRMK